jgi:flagellar hook-associated protein 3 FlgL
MRISTAAMHNLALTAMLRQQAELSKTQNQIATGKRIQTPADDPIAAAQLFELSRTQSQLGQFDKNSTAATSRLKLEEQSLADAGTALQRVRELVLQANNATLGDSDLRSILTEVQSRTTELQAIANRKDAGGEFLFAGFATTTQPFVRDASGQMVYAGDAGTRQLQIDAAQFVNDSDSGWAVFADITEGNGTYAAAASAANTGSGILDPGSVVDRSQWIPDDYTISFTTAADWEVTDSAGNAVVNGTYSSGGSIVFRGVQLSVSGTPAAGDAFTVNQAGTEDVFATLDRLAATLQGGGGTEASRAQIHSALGGTLQQLDQATDHLLTLRASVGARLSLVENVDDARSLQGNDIAGAISGLEDLDYTAAISKMTQQYIGLQAAQQTYSNLSKLALFNYL